MVKHKKNEEYSITITDIGTNGEGIGHLDDGYTLFINGAVPGDEVLAHIIKPQKNYGIARVQKIISPSPDRITPSCPVSDKCGGCQIASLSYDRQLTLKEKKVHELLLRVGGFSEDLIDSIFQPIVGFYDSPQVPVLNAPSCYFSQDLESGSPVSKTPVNFRNKAQYPVGTDADGNIIMGFYTAHSHRIIPCDNCLIGSPFDAEILDVIKEYMSRNRIPAYDETTCRGLIRHIMIRTGYFTGEIMVCLVINGAKLPEKDDLISALLALNINAKITSICTSSNTSDTNVIMGNSFEVLFGQGYLTDMIGDLKFKISPLSFFQVNPVQTNKLYSLALAASKLTGTETVWDLYCGIGTISLFLARSAREVYGVEIVEAAIHNAIENAALNDIPNAHFYVGKAEEVLPAHCKEHQKPDVIVVDPPRKGCDSICLDTILELSPSKVIYVSCDPATLARDLKYLCADSQYSLRSVTPVDMFPNSSHVETVVLITRKEK